jgi:hypothetical protein
VLIWRPKKVSLGETAMGRTEAMEIDRASRESAAPARSQASSLRLYRIDHGLAIAINQKIIAALGLAALAWASIAGIAWALIAA